jgi:hypothetical protein
MTIPPGQESVDILNESSLCASLVRSDYDRACELVEFAGHLGEPLAKPDDRIGRAVPPTPAGFGMSMASRPATEDPAAACLFADEIKGSVIQVSEVDAMVIRAAPAENEEFVAITQVPRDRERDWNEYRGWSPHSEH